MSHRFFYLAIFEPEDIGFSVYIPDIPGCMTQGDTMEEAMHMAQDAIELMLEDKSPNQYPKPSTPEELEITDRQFIKIIQFDIWCKKSRLFIGSFSFLPVNIIITNQRDVPTL